MSKWNELHPIGTLWGDPLPGAPAFASRGTVITGVRTMTLIQPGQADVLAGMKDTHFPRYDRPLVCNIWYPAYPGSDETRAVYTDHMGRIDLGNLVPFSIPGRAYRDAEPDKSFGPCPVIVISHGYPGSRYLLVNLAENLSSKGYIVVSIGHTDNTYEDFPKTGSLESALIHRSLDQRFIISCLPKLNEEGFLKGMLQAENVGLIGFSMGGYGALRTIGARMSSNAMHSFSAFADELQEASDFKGLKTVKAAVLFAPATFWFDPSLSENIDIPTLWLCGTADHTVHYEAVRDFCLQARKSDRIFVSYEGCGHNVANNPAPLEAYGQSWEIFKRWSDPVWDTWRLNNANAHFVTAFMDHQLKGESGKADYLKVSVTRGAEAVSALDEKGVPTDKHTYWKGFVDGTAAGIRLEVFPSDSCE